MNKRDRIRLDDIEQVVGKILARSVGLSEVEFNQNEDLQVVLTHFVQIIGEAASRISHEFRDEHPEVPWKDIIGMRNRIVHDYVNVDLEILWSVVTRNVPELERQIRRISKSDINGSLVEEE